MKIEYIEFTSPGAVRVKNEDSVFAAVQGGYGIFAAADGMGGYFGGEIASGRLTKALEKWWQGFIKVQYGFERCYDSLRQTVYDVNGSIYSEFSSRGEICGTTVALLFIYEDRYIVLNSGDTRIYSKRGLELRQESVDHVFGREAEISGLLTVRQVKESPDRNKLTAAVGIGMDPKIYIAASPLNKKVFFICSDGVYKFCNPRCLRIAAAMKDPREYIRKKVSQNGAPDNYSFIRIEAEPNGKVK